MRCPLGVEGTKTPARGHPEDPRCHRHPQPPSRDHIPLFFRSVLPVHEDDRAGGFSPSTLGAGELMSSLTKCSLINCPQAQMCPHFFTAP